MIERLRNNGKNPILKLRLGNNVYLNKNANAQNKRGATKWEVGAVRVIVPRDVVVAAVVPTPQHQTQISIELRYAKECYKELSVSALSAD